ncbi:hypothetical protein AOCH_006409 [Aspergillus ochraceoroseus]|uniref:Rho-GAP domain-containing protein n=1 Tax=Aspergillus ochraceoroseus TaxID=138278 RepID=A0A0F8WLR1_9EURO|nr:hypothetical protein AOCH_006409 [Aspergillus ochraceoroseus]
MRLLDSILSRSSTNRSNGSPDVSRSWALAGRTQSNAANVLQQNAVLPVESISTGNEVEMPKADTILSNECHGSQNGQPPDSHQQKLTAENSILHVDSCTSKSAGEEPIIPHTTLKRSTGSYRRLAGFKTLFSSRKSPRKKLDLNINPSAKQEPCDASGHIEVQRCGNTEEQENDGPPVQQVPPPFIHASHDTELRKVSGKTEDSLDSNKTSVTVYRRASKRTSMPIALADDSSTDRDPFDDVWEASRLETNTSNPFADQSTSTSDSTGQSIPVYRNSSNPLSSDPRHVLKLSGSSGSSWCLSTLSKVNTWPTPIDRRIAIVSFNELAPELCLEPLALSAEDPKKGVIDIQPAGGEQSFIVSKDDAIRRRDRLLRRIRSMRSTLQMKSEPFVPHTRTLRRMKTFAGFSSRSPLMTSLKNKSLETLARLGGYGFLTLPGDFAPATLSLPVCFVAVINYLRCFAPTVPNLFLDDGDMETSVQTYEYFANQVLSAEKEQETIQMTMRSSRMPSFIEEGTITHTESRSAGHVLGVALTFKALLAGLPGGILGSRQLHRILVHIYYGRPSKAPIEPPGSRLVGLSPKSYTKVKAISLAMVALTSPMQLNLICAVFGFCSLLLHESERMFELERRKLRGSVRRPSGPSGARLSEDRLGDIFGPLLMKNDRAEAPDMFQTIQLEIENQRVVAMVVGNWRSISDSCGSGSIVDWRQECERVPGTARRVDTSSIWLILGVDDRM